MACPDGMGHTLDGKRVGDTTTVQCAQVAVDEEDLHALGGFNDATLVEQV
jgi:hypothetical protein